MNPTLTQITILNTFIKSDISTPPLTPPENSSMELVWFAPQVQTTDPILPWGQKSHTRVKFEQNTKRPFWSISFLVPCPWPRTNLQTKYEYNWAPFSWRHCCTHTFGRWCLSVFLLNQHLAGAKIHVKLMTKSKIECCHSITQIIYYISSINFFHQILYFEIGTICITMSQMCVQPLLIWTFWPAWRTQKFKLYKFLPCTLSSIQI